MWNFPPYFFLLPISCTPILSFSYLWTRSSPWNLSHIRGVERELKKESGNPVEPILPRKERYLFAIHPPTGRKLGSRTCLEFFSLPNRTYGIWDRWWTRAEQKSISIFGVGGGGTQTKKVREQSPPMSPIPGRILLFTYSKSNPSGNVWKILVIIHLLSIYLHSY